MFNYRNNIYDIQEALKKEKEKRKKAQQHEKYLQTAIFENDLI